MVPVFLYSRKIYITTNFNCNLSCVYCYEKNKSNTEFDVDEAIKILRELLNTKTEHGTKIKLHGGEPFLAFPQIKKLCESIWRENFPEYYHFHITTNGTLVHGEIQDWLFQNREKITLKLSLDGNKWSNDLNRPNSFDQIDVPFFVKTWPGIRVNMTITPSTLSCVSENVKYLHSVGFNFIFSRFSLLTNWADCHMERVFLEQLLDLVTFYLDNPNITPCEFFQYNIEWTLHPNVLPFSCNVDQSYAYDFQTKKNYPCHMCFPSVCGKKASTELGKMNLVECVDQEEECCKQCPFINICQTCLAENYIIRGSISRRDLSLCSYKKIVFVALFKYEYERILRLDNPTEKDVKKMLAIQKWLPEIQRIEDCFC